MNKKRKSPSQRLRNTLYKVWEWFNLNFRGKFNNSFDNYYESYIEDQINKLKNEI